MTRMCVGPHFHYMIAHTHVCLKAKMVSTRKATRACAQTNIRTRACVRWGHVPVCKVTSAYVCAQATMRRHVCMRDKDGQKTCTYVCKGMPARKRQAVRVYTHSCVHRRKYARVQTHVCARAAHVPGKIHSLHGCKHMCAQQDMFVCESKVTRAH